MWEADSKLLEPLTLPPRVCISWCQTANLGTLKWDVDILAGGLISRPNASPLTHSYSSPRLGLAVQVVSSDLYAAPCVSPALLVTTLHLSLACSCLSLL